MRTVCDCNWLLKPFSLAKGFQTSENAPTRIKFHTLRSASKGFALLKPTTFSKRWTKTFVRLRREAFGFRANNKAPIFRTVFCRKTGTRAFSCGATQIGFVKPTLRIRNKVPNLLCCDNGADSVDAYLKSKFVRAALISPFKTATDTALSPAAAL